ncbi:MAG: nucleotide sugar dehydrogenase [Candidatus Muiribacteriota bacterium]
MKTEKIKIGVIGLGYVGLPLAVAFAEKFKVTGFDINKKRVEELIRGIDKTNEVDAHKLTENPNIKYTVDINDLKGCNIFIITVPTPIDEFKVPDLSFIKKASEQVGSILKKEDIVVFESTVYPGVTEDICVDILKEKSGLEYNKEFYVGYSPERINPGDKKHTFSNIKKVVSGSDNNTLQFISKLYRSVVNAGVFEASSIKAAEAAKVIENTQRDVNIALINELAMLFNHLGIDTKEVLEAAGTKWNFLKFKPGLVGGHCIGVDPYYLTYKAQKEGFLPQMILAGRRINDGVGKYVTEQVIKLMTQKKIHVVDSKILILGFTFKENCPDTRNTRVVDIFRELKKYHADIDIWDPVADSEETFKEYNIKITNKKPSQKYDALILAVGHDEFRKLNYQDINKLLKNENVVYDIKSFFQKSYNAERL